jgi:hypothetical protein
MPLPLLLPASCLPLLCLPQDKTMNFSDNSTYRHWGTLDLGIAGNVSEPNGNGKGSPIELCGFANYSEAYPCHATDPPGTPTAFGWADTVCTRKYVSICRVMRGWRAALVAPYALRAVLLQS